MKSTDEILETSVDVLVPIGTLVSDGVLGEQTVTRLQEWLNVNHELWASVSDEKLSVNGTMDSNTVQAFQGLLNTCWHPISPCPMYVKSVDNTTMKLHRRDGRWWWPVESA